VSGLSLLGLGVKAGTVVIGTSGVRSALQRNELALVVVAGDVSARTEAKVLRLARAKDVPVIAAPSADALGQSVGRDAVQAVGVRDRQLAQAIGARMEGDRGSGGSV
jgi:ribosomal protein L7Ae-like RNA K-turn-binding protein